MIRVSQVWSCLIICISGCLSLKLVGEPGVVNNSLLLLTTSTGLGKDKPDQVFSRDVGDTQEDLVAYRGGLLWNSTNSPRHVHIQAISHFFEDEHPMTSTLDYLACHDLERIFSPSHDLDRSRHSGTMDSPVGYDRRQLSTSTYHDYHPTRWIDDHLDDLYGYDSDTYLDPPL